MDTAIYAGIPAWELAKAPSIWLHWYREHGAGMQALQDLKMSRSRN